MPKIQAGTVELFYAEYGEGLPVLCVHGFPLDHSMWQGQYSSSISGVRWIVPDLRGFGASQVSSGLVTMAQYADDLAALLDAMGVDGPVVYCGLSMGGYVGWEMADRHRQRLAAMILCDTRAAADTPETARGRQLLADRVLADGPEQLVQSMVPKLFHESAIASQREWVKSTKRVMETSSRQGIAAALRGMAQRRDLRTLAAALHLPVLLLCGVNDGITPLTEMEELARTMPQATLVPIPDSAHMAPLENPGAANQAIQAFLQRLPSLPSGGKY